MQDSILSEKVAQGGIWLFSLRFLSRGLGFVRTIILARLLAPADFGLVGISLLAISTLDSLSQTGLQPALIQKKDSSRACMDTAWTFLVIRGIVLFLILFLSAPAISRFFKMPAVDLLIKVIAISVILSGFRNIGIVHFQKEMKFDKHFKYEICGSLIDLIVSIIFAFLLRNVWALVWGGLAGNVARFVMSYRLSDYRPRLAIDRTELYELFSFGKWILGTGVVYSVLAQVDSFTIGKIIGPTDLGYYQMAVLIAFLPSSEISYVLSQITFPAYSVIQDDSQRLKSAYLDVLRFTSLISIPIGVLLFVVAPEFIALFLGKAWLPVISCIQILVFSGISISITTTTMPVFSAKGKPKLETYLQACNLIILIILVYPLTKRYGINGTAAAILMGHFTLTCLSLYTVAKLLDFQFITLAKALIFPLANAVCMGIMISVLKRMTADSAGLIQFAYLIGAALVSYGTLTIVLDKISGYGMIRLLKGKWEMVVRSKLFYV